MVPRMSRGWRWHWYRKTPDCADAKVAEDRAGGGDEDEGERGEVQDFADRVGEEDTVQPR